MQKYRPIHFLTYALNNTHQIPTKNGLRWVDSMLQLDGSDQMAIASRFVRLMDAGAVYGPTYSGSPYAHKIAPRYDVVDRYLLDQWRDRHIHAD